MMVTNVLAHMLQDPKFDVQGLSLFNGTQRHCNYLLMIQYYFSKEIWPTSSGHNGPWIFIIQQQESYFTCKSPMHFGLPTMHAHGHGEFGANT